MEVKVKIDADVKMHEQEEVDSKKRKSQEGEEIPPQKEAKKAKKAKKVKKVKSEEKIEKKVKKEIKMQVEVEVEYEEKIVVEAEVEAEATSEKPGIKMAKLDADSTKSDNADENSSDVMTLSSPDFDPIKYATWPKDSPVPYFAVSRALGEIEKISSRLKRLEILTNLFRTILVTTPKDLTAAIYLCINKIAPNYEGGELGVGDSVLMKAIAEGTGRSMDSLKASYHSLGDLGIVAQTSKSRQMTFSRPPILTIQHIFQTFKVIANSAGSTVVNLKKDRIKNLLLACREKEESIYLIRSLQGRLRIGLAEKSVLTALAKSVVLSPPATWGEEATKKPTPEILDEAVEILNMVYRELPNYDAIIPQLLLHNIKDLHNYCYCSPGIPVQAMLAQPTKGIGEVLDRFSETPIFTNEFKYDGERAQVHMTDEGAIHIFSRNMETHTAKYPDIVKNLKKSFVHDEIKSFIIDCEAVGYDPVKDKLLPFQVLATRARKCVRLEDIKVPVCLFLFDILYLHGKSVMHETLSRRREIMKENFKDVDNELRYASSIDTPTVEAIQDYLNAAVAGQCEGLMIKDLASKYHPGARSFAWLKAKKDYLDGMTDSLDLVPIGAFLGKGKRTGVYGAFLLACYDDENEEYQTITKIGTGFSEAIFEQHSAFLNEHVINQPRRYFRYDENAKPDVWFDPVQVWEVLAADLSVSPLYKAASGLVDPVKGASLRFPRFIQIRNDKNPEDATNAKQVARMYHGLSLSKQEETGTAPKDNDARDTSSQGGGQTT
eukprot:TRINITY_DN504_c0_g1_i1.p1 TRINITY_DN504_c0_g1~~TRINITY_DN504_c0_g1_i1.p1  ORF type:complete len:872 (+),score=306.11 TRINITY_DN504_c0_g1_i1:292-2616(+)